MTVLEELEGLAEEDYKKFNLRIIPTSQHVLGVRLPSLRKIAKQVVKGDVDAFLQEDKGNVYEMIMLEGLVLAHLKSPFTELLPLVENYLAKVDNWAQVDSPMGEFKRVREQRESVLVVIERWLQTDQEFVVRSGLVLLLAHYMEERYLSTIFSLSQRVHHQGYYVHMGNAWLISVCMAHFPLQTLEFFKKNRLDDRTHNKAIQKSRESYRVSQEHKEILKRLKR